MNIVQQEIFITRLWSIDLSHLKPHFNDWRKAVQNLQHSDMQPRGRSNRLGWNSQPTLMALEIFKPLQQECAQAFNAIMQKIYPKINCQYQIMAWANVNNYGSFNTLHCHPGVPLSAVFYLTTPEGSGRLVFRDPRPAIVHSIFHEFLDHEMNGDVSIAPKEGMLTVFPSWLEHYVEPHQNQIPRVSIAMNVQPVGLPSS